MQSGLSLTYRVCYGHWQEQEVSDGTVLPGNTGVALGRSQVVRASHLCLLLQVKVAGIPKGGR